MRIADGFLAFPDTIVAIVLSGLLGAGIGNLVLAIVIVKWVSYARLVRSTVLAESQKTMCSLPEQTGCLPARSCASIYFLILQGMFSYSPVSILEK